MQWIILDRVDEGGRRLEAVRLTDGARRTLVEHDQAVAYRAAIDPTGRLVCAILAEPAPAGRSTTRCALIDLDRGAVRWLRASLEPELHLHSARFSGDGRRIVAEVTHGAALAQDILVFGFDPDHPLDADAQAMLAGAGNPERMGLRSPMFSPSGDQIFYLRRTAGDLFQVVVLDVDKDGDSAAPLKIAAPSRRELVLTEPMRLAPDAGLVYCGRSRLLFFSYVLAGRQRLARKPLTGQPPRSFWRAHEAIDCLVADPDGAGVVYAAEGQLWWADIELDDVLTLVPEAPGLGPELVRCLPGGWVLYATHDEAGAHLHALHRPSRADEVLWSGPGHLFGFAAVPDDEAIVARFAALPPGPLADYVPSDDELAALASAQEAEEARQRAAEEAEAARRRAAEEQAAREAEEAARAALRRQAEQLAAEALAAEEARAEQLAALEAEAEARRARRAEAKARRIREAEARAAEEAAAAARAAEEAAAAREAEEAIAREAAAREAEEAAAREAAAREAEEAAAREAAAREAEEATAREAAAREAEEAAAREAAAREAEEAAAREAEETAAREAAAAREAEEAAAARDADEAAAAREAEAAAAREAHERTMRAREERAARVLAAVREAQIRAAQDAREAEERAAHEAREAAAHEAAQWAEERRAARAEADARRLSEERAAREAEARRRTEEARAAQEAEETRRHAERETRRQAEEARLAAELRAREQRLSAQAAPVASENVGDARDANPSRQPGVRAPADVPTVEPDAILEPSEPWRPAAPVESRLSERETGVPDIDLTPALAPKPRRGPNLIGALGADLASLAHVAGAGLLGMYPLYALGALWVLAAISMHVGARGASAVGAVAALATGTWWTVVAAVLPDVPPDLARGVTIGAGVVLLAILLGALRRRR